MIRAWESESELALKAVSVAGERSLERPDHLNFSTKESMRDIVTEMDLLLEGMIRKTLSSSDYPIIGEEQGGQADAQSDVASWWVDPIDGTANYANKIPFYGISVGLVQKSKFILGAVAAPANKELYFTFGSDVAYLNGKKLSVASSNLNQALVAMSFAGSNKKLDYEVFQEVNEQTRGVLRTGSAALNICYVAVDRFQAAFGFANKVWDIAGAVAVARAAGALVKVEFIDSTTCRYLVAAPGVFEPLKKLFVSKGLFNEI